MADSLQVPAICSEVSVSDPLPADGEESERDDYGREVANAHDVP
jgi:hypothetical protein